MFVLTERTILQSMSRKLRDILYSEYSQITKRINDFSRSVLSLCQCFSAAVHHLSTVNPASCGMIGTFILCKKLSELQLLSSNTELRQCSFISHCWMLVAKSWYFFWTNSELLNPTFYMTEIIFLNSYFLSFTANFYQTWE